jgi:hypothetical protein
MNRPSFPSNVSERNNQLVVQRLMIPFLVIMLDERSHSTSQRLFSEEHHSVQALRLQCQNEPFRVGVGINVQLQLVRTVFHEWSGSPIRIILFQDGNTI